MMVSAPRFRVCEAAVRGLHELTTTDLSRDGLGIPRPGELVSAGLLRRVWSGGSR
jgi:hypothetical protein